MSLNVRRTRSWTEEASRLIAQGEDESVSPEVLLKSYRNCLQKLKHECEFLSLKVTAIENSNNAKVVNDLIAKELVTANEQWEVKLEMLRQEFRDSFRKICKCTDISTYKCSKCAAESASKLHSLSAELQNVSHQLDEEKKVITSEFERRLQEILHEQFDCRLMVEGDQSLGDSQKSVVLTQLQQLHNSELDSVIAKYDKKLSEEKEKVEKLEFEVLELQAEEKSLEDALKTRIEELEKENFALKEENLHIRIKAASSNAFGSGDMSCTAGSNMTESGICSGTVSTNTNGKALLYSSNHATSSPAGILVPMGPTGSSVRSFPERDWDLSHKLDQLTEQMTYGMSSCTLENMSSLSFGVDSHRTRSICIKGDIDGEPTASSPRVLETPDDEAIENRETPSVSEANTICNPVMTPSLNKSMFLNIPNQQEIKFAFEALPLPEQKQLLSELTFQAQPSEAFEPQPDKELFEKCEQTEVISSTDKETSIANGLSEIIVDSELVHEVTCASVCLEKESVCSNHDILIETKMSEKHTQTTETSQSSDTETGHGGIEDSSQEIRRQLLDIHILYQREIVHMCNQILSSDHELNGKSSEEARMYERNLGKLKAITSHVQEVQKELEVFTSERHEVTSDLAELSEVNERLSKDKAILLEKLEISEKLLDVSETEKLILKEEKESLQNVIVPTVEKIETSVQTEVIVCPGCCQKDSELETLELDANENRILSNEMSEELEALKNTLEQLNSEKEQNHCFINEMGEKISSRDVEILKLKDEVDMLVRTVAELDASKSSLQLKCEGSEAEIEELKNKLKVKTGELKVLSSQYQAMTERFDNSLELIEKFQSEISRLNETVTGLSEQVSTIDKCEQASQTQLYTDNESNTTSSKFDQAKSVMFDSFEDQLVSLLVQNAINDAVVDLKSSENCRLLSEFANSSNRNSELNEKLNELKRDSQEKISNLTAEKEQLEKCVQNLNEVNLEVENLRSLIDEKEAELKELRSFKSEFEFAAGENDEKLKNLAAEVESVKIEYSLLKELNDSFKQNLERQVIENSELKIKIDMLESEKIEIAEENSENEEKLKAANSLVDSLQAEISNLTFDLQASVQAKDDAQNKWAELEKVKTELTDKVEFLESEKSNLESQVSDIAAVKLLAEKLKQEVTLKDSEVSQLTDEIGACKQRIEELTECLKQDGCKFSQMEVDKEKAEEKMERLIDEQAEAIAKLALDHAVEINQLKCEMSDLNEKQNEERKEFQVQIETKDERLLKYETDKLTYENTVEELTAQLNFSEREKSETFLKIEQLEKEKLDCQESLDRMKKENEEKLYCLTGELSAKIDSLSSCHRENVNEIERAHEKQVENLQSKVNFYISEMQKAESFIEILNEKVEKLELAVVDQSKLQTQELDDDGTNEEELLLDYIRNICSKLNLESRVASLDADNESASCKMINALTAIEDVIDSKTAEFMVMKEELKRLTDINDSLVLDSLELENNRVGLNAIPEDEVLRICLTDLDQDSPQSIQLIDNQALSRSSVEQIKNKETSEQHEDADSSLDCYVKEFSILCNTHAKESCEQVEESNVLSENRDQKAAVSDKSLDNYVIESPVLQEACNSRHALPLQLTISNEERSNEHDLSEMTTKNVYSKVGPKAGKIDDSSVTPFVTEVLKKSPRKRLCCNEECNREVLKLMTKFDQQLANQTAVAERRAREIAELNELINLMQADSKQLRKTNDDIVLEYDSIVEVLNQVAKDQMETMRILTSKMDIPIEEEAEVADDNQVPTRDREENDDEDTEKDRRKMASLGLNAASQLASIATGLKASRFRTADEIANWDMESLSPNATYGSIDFSFNNDEMGHEDFRTVTPAGSSTGRKSRPRRSFRNLTQYAIESGEGLFTDVLLHKVVLSSSQELKSCIEKLLDKVSNDIKRKESNKRQNLRRQTGKVLEDIDAVVQQIADQFSSIIENLFPNQKRRKSQSIANKESSSPSMSDSQRKSLERKSKVDESFEGAPMETPERSPPSSPQMATPMKLLGTLDSLKADLAKHEQEIKQLKSKTDLLVKLEASNEELNYELNKKTDEVSRLQDELGEVLTRNREHGFAFEDLKAKMSELNDLKERMKVEKEQMEHKMDQIREESENESSARVEEVKKQNEECLRGVLQELGVIKKTIGEKDAQIQMLKRELIALADKLENHVVDEFTRGQIDQASSEITLEDSLAKLSSVVERNSAIIAKYKAQSVIVEKLQMSNAQLIELVDSKTRTIDDLEAKITDLESLREAVDQANHETEELKKSFESEKAELKEQIETLKEEIKASSESFEEKEYEHHQTVTNMGQKIEELQYLSHEKEAKLLKVQEKLDLIVQWFNESRQIEASKTTEGSAGVMTESGVPDLGVIGEIDHPVAVSIEMLKQSIDDNRKQISTLHSSMASIDKLKSENDTLKTKMASNLEELAGLRADVEEFSMNNQHLKAMCDQFEEKHCQFDKLKEELENEKAKAVASLEAVKRELLEAQRHKSEITEQTKVDIRGLKSEIEKLRDELLVSQKYISELSAIRDSQGDNERKAQDELQSKVSQLESSVRTLEKTNQGLQKSNLESTGENSSLKEQIESLKTECSTLERRCAQVEQEKLQLKFQYEEALRRMSLPSIPSPIEMPSKEKIRDDGNSTMMLLQTPNRLSLGESPLITAPSYLSSFSTHADLSKTHLNPVADVNEDDPNGSRESDVYHSVHEEDMIGCLADATENNATSGVELDREKEALRALNQSLKNFIIQCNNLTAQALDLSSDNDWRLELMKSVQNIFIHERDLIVEEAKLLNNNLNQKATHSIDSDGSDLMSKLNKKIDRLSKLIQDAVSQIRVTDRVSLISEVKELKKRLNSKPETAVARQYDSKFVQRLEQKVFDLENELRQQQLIGADLNTRLRLESEKCKDATTGLNKLKQELTKLKIEHKKSEKMSSISNATAQKPHHKLNETFNKEKNETQMKENFEKLKKSLKDNEETISDMKKELVREKEKSAAFKAEAELHRNYSNDVLAELSHLEQKTVYELNDKLTSMQTQLKASENNLWEKTRAFNIARNTISDLTTELESLKFEFAEMRKGNSKLELRNKTLEKAEKDLTKKLQVKESELKSVERSCKLAQSRCSDLQTSRDTRVSQLERQLEAKERQLEESRVDRDKLQRQVDSISEQVETCKLHIQKLTLSKESFEAERENLFTLIEEQKLAINKLEKETLSLKASKRGHRYLNEAEKENSLDTDQTYTKEDTIQSPEEVDVIERDVELRDPNECTEEDHVTAFQQYVESVRANVQIALTRYLEAVQIFQSHGNKESFMLETKHILTSGKDCLRQIQQIAEKYVIMPSQTTCKSLLALNEKLIQQNRELTDIVSLLTNDRLGLQRKLDESHLKATATHSNELQMQKLYSSFLRADSRRKNLLYQKRYLLLLIEGFRSYEDSALRMISEMGLLPAGTFSKDLTSGSLLCRNVKITPFRRLKGCVRAVMAVWRMKQLVLKWTHICNPTIPKHISSPSTLSLPPPPHRNHAYPPHSVHTPTGANNTDRNSAVSASSGRTWVFKHGAASHSNSAAPATSQQPAVGSTLSNASHATYVKGHKGPPHPPGKGQQNTAGQKSSGFRVPTSSDDVKSKGHTGLNASQTSEHHRTGSGDYEDPLVSRYRNRLTEMQHKLSSINCGLQNDKNY